MDHFERIHKSKAGHQYYDDEQAHPYQESHHSSRIFHMDLVSSAMRRIMHNKTMFAVAVGIVLLLVVVVIVIISMILPHAYQFITSIEQSGLKGIVDSILPFIKKLWEGTGSG
jgi:hypothetical protein